MTNWAIELAADPRLVGHQAAAAVLATAAHAMALIGHLDEGEQFAERAMALVTDHDNPVARRCAFARGSLDLFRGRLAQARQQFATAAHGDYWQCVATDLAALCAAYSGDLHDAHRLNASTLDIATAPSARAHHHYVAAEIDALAGSWETAEQHYRDAIEFAVAANAAFVHGVASVGLVALYTTRRQHRQALHGYAELIDHWERTGAWTQQWTTLRNAADLFDQLGDHQLGAILRHAADHAPEAANIAQPPTPDTTATPPTCDPRRDPHPDANADGAALTRDEVLKLTRHAITHWLATTPT
jgi:tetratricopeptide (TPR) repeat protein